MYKSYKIGKSLFFYDNYVLHLTILLTHLTLGGSSMNKLKLSHVLLLLLSSYGMWSFTNSILTFLLLYINLDAYALLISSLLTLCYVYFFIKQIKADHLRNTYFNYLPRQRFIFVLTFCLFTLFNLTIDRPLPFLTTPYDISLVPVETAEDLNIKLNLLYIDGHQVDLATQEMGSWQYDETFSTPITNATPYVLSNITNELIGLTFIKDPIGGHVALYHDDELIKTIDLNVVGDYQLGVKASKDYLGLLIPAYIGLFIALYFITHRFVVAKILTRQSFKHRLRHLNQREVLYYALPLLFILGFRYTALFNASIRLLLILLFSLFMIIIELLAYQRFYNTAKQRAFQLTRASFYLTVTSMLAVVILAFIYFLPHYDLSIMWIANNVNLILLTASVILSISVLLFTLFNNYILGTTISVLFIIIAGFANYYKMLIVGEPIYASDLSMITNMDDIISYAQSFLSPTLIMSLVIAFVVLLLLSLRYFKSYKLHGRYRVSALLGALLYLLCIFNYENSFLKPIVTNSVNFVMWNQLTNYEENGFVFGFITNMQNDLMIKSDAYNKDNMLELVDYYKQKASTYNETLKMSAKPNIMVVVSESLSDPTAFDQLTFSDDPLANIHQLMSEHTSGGFISPFKGNRTANIEFELLTGFSNALLLEGTVPFQQSLSSMDYIPSMLNHLNTFDYKTVAIHPNNAAFYKRSSVYPAIGFDQFISIENMVHTDLIESEKYVSDEAVFNEMLDELYRSESPALIYGLTMQNHLPTFENKFGETSIDVTDKNGDKDIELEMEQYAEGVKLTDIAFNDFVNTIQAYEEPTVVLFFGDHLINFNSDLHANHGFVEGNNDANSAKLFYETPLLMLSNTDLFKANDLGDVSPIFLAPLLFKELQLPLSPYYVFLLDLYEQLHVIHQDFALDANDHPLLEPTQLQTQLLTALELIQYDVLEGEQYILDSLFNITN